MGQSAEEGRISVLLADDHHLLAETLRLYLEAQGGFAVTVVGTLDEALAALRGADFDCALLDLDMPGMFGLAGLERAMAVTTAPVVLFSGLVRGDGGMRAVELGAAGFIPKTLGPQSVAAAIRLVAAGERYVPMADRRPRAPTADGVPLTRREEQVLRQLCEGATNRDIAGGLGLTEVAVKMHVRTLCAKLGAANRTQAAIIGMQSGLV